MYLHLKVVPSQTLVVELDKGTSLCSIKGIPKMLYETRPGNWCNADTRHCKDVIMYHCPFGDMGTFSFNERHYIGL